MFYSNHTVMITATAFGLTFAAKRFNELSASSTGLIRILQSATKLTKGNADEPGVKYIEFCSHQIYKSYLTVENTESGFSAKQISGDSYRQKGGDKYLTIGLQHYDVHQQTTQTDDQIKSTRSFESIKNSIFYLRKPEDDGRGFEPDMFRKMHNKYATRIAVAECINPSIPDTGTFRFYTGNQLQSPCDKTKIGTRIECYAIPYDEQRYLIAGDYSSNRFIENDNLIIEKGISFADYVEKKKMEVEYNRTFLYTICGAGFIGCFIFEMALYGRK
jgi:hypothetical protein